jgi:hypothetical protein
VLEEVLRRLPDYRIDGGRQYPSIGVINGWISLPATFSPNRRTGRGVLPEVPQAGRITREKKAIEQQ